MNYNLLAPAQHLDLVRAAIGRDKNRRADFAERFVRAIADKAAAYVDRNFGLPVVLIWIDTVITAAGYNEGGDNDTAASQKVMSALSDPV